MNPVLIDIRDIIVDDENTNYIFGDDIFISKQPAFPINCITLFETTTTPPDMTLGNTTYLRENIMILIRNQSWMGGQQVAQDIINILNEKSNFIKNETTYLGIFLINGPNQINSNINDDVQKYNKSSCLTLNFEIQKEKN